MPHKDPEARREYNRRYRERTRAIRNGELARESFIEGAHHFYDRPLDVRWLCQTCHRKWDAAQPKGYAV